MPCPSLKSPQHEGAVHQHKLPAAGPLGSGFGGCVGGGRAPFAAEARCGGASSAWGMHERGRVKQQAWMFRSSFGPALAATFPFNLKAVLSLWRRKRKKGKNSPGIPQGFPRDLLGIPKGFPRDSQGIPKGFPRDSLGIPKGFPTDSEGIP